MRMADITANAAAKRPFDEHRHAVLMLRVFCLENRGRSVAAREPETFRRSQRLIGGAILTVWPILVPGASYYIAPVPLFWLTYRCFPIGRVVRYPDGRVGGVVVIEAPDLLHARLKAALAGADRELEFVSGYQLGLSAEQIPANMMGRLLNRGDLRKLHQMLLKKKPIRHRWDVGWPQGAGWANHDPQGQNHQVRP
jgi:hypothetical protein